MTPFEKQINIDNLLAYKTKDPKLYSAVPGWGSYVDNTQNRMLQKINRRVSGGQGIEENNVFYNKRFKNNSSHQMASCMSSQDDKMMLQSNENQRNNYGGNWISYLSQKNNAQ